MKKSIIKNSKLLFNSINKRNLGSGLINTNISKMGFKQTNNLIDIHNTAEFEFKSRTAKFLEYTNKVYKPSKTIQFDRNGELLLYYCDNIKHSNVYFKYPYIMIDLLAPIALYNFFIDPCKLKKYLIYMLYFK